MSHFTRSAKRYQELVASGLCGRCGQRPPRKGLRLCGKCQTYRTENRDSWAKKRVAAKVCVGCGKKPEGKHQKCSKCKAKASEILKRERAKLKLEVFNAYGGARCACKNCPEHTNPHPSFLTLNHINQDGAAHRKALYGVNKGVSVNRWLRQNKFPPGFNVLCWNCQWGSYLNGGKCPHETEKL